MASKSTVEKIAALVAMEPPEGERQAWEKHLEYMTPAECADLYDQIISVAKLLSSNDVPPSWRKFFKASPMMKLLEGDLA